MGVGLWGFAVDVSTGALFGGGLKGNEGRIGDEGVIAGFRGAVRGIGGLGQALGGVLRL